MSILLTACSGGEGYGGSVDGPAAPGGDGTVDVSGAGAFSQPAANLSEADRALFQIGDMFFTQPWSPALSGTEDRDGLGPTFLASSCAGCHLADGRDSPPGANDTAGTPIIRFTDENREAATLEGYGVQIQTHAVSRVPEEARLRVEWIEELGAYPDGTPFTLRRPKFTLDGLAFGAVDSMASGIRLAPSLIGLGLLEAITSTDVRANADAHDGDGDGISGVASVVMTERGEALGRFGLKANVATVADQVAMAYLFDMGITSPVYPTENCPTPQVACAQAASGGSPEISAERLAAVVLYARTIAVPARVGLEDESIVDGELIFDSLGCAACHVKRWETGGHQVSSLAYQAIYPYTDLLLHDMGEGLSDGRSDRVAGPREWRTTPLWGLGLQRTVNPDAGFLHDGRARSIEEAVLWHGGEATQARTAFTELTASDRTLILLFLKSL
jgi:CxxC motif-containing protein (DUF1111 family)